MVRGQLSLAAAIELADAGARTARLRHVGHGGLALLCGVSLLVLMPRFAQAQTIDNSGQQITIGTGNTNDSLNPATPIDNGPNGWEANYGTVTKVGSGTLTLNGGTIIQGETYITAGSALQSAGDTSISYLTVGEGTGNTGTLNVSGGTLTLGSGLQVGDFGGTGTVNQTGGTVTVEQGCGNAAHCASFNIGNQGGNGTYNISGSSTLGLSGGLFIIGRNDASHAASTGLLNLNGGTVSVSAGELIIGDNLLMSGGSIAGSGTITQTAGTLSIGSDATLFLSGSGNGTYNLNGGTLAIGGSSLVGNYNNMGGTYAFNLGGGTIQVTGSALTASVNATLAGGTNSTIDTNGLGAAWSGILSGDGALTKAGDGTLTLSGANTYGGGTTVSGGTLALSGSGTAGTGRLTLDAGTTFDISATTAGATVGSLAGSGTIDTGTKALFAGGDNSDSSFSGTIDNGGVGWDAQYGTFTKTGTGTLDISGATITGGETYIAGGAMAQTSGTTQINYLTVGEGTGNTGNLNISGGSLTFSTGLQVGDFGGTGTVNQTGGTVTIEQGCGNAAHCASFNIGNQGGNGTYNISGAGSALDLSGGIFVIGRNTGANPASTGLININGGVVSVSDGELIIGDNSVATTAGSGTITQTAGTLSIGSDATLFLSGSGNGTYNLNGGTLAIGGSSLVGNYNNMGGTYAFNLGGGTIQVTGSALTASVNATLAGGTNSTIDTNGLGAAWSGILSGDGALTKAGDGTLTLSGANTYGGGTTVSGGTLALSGSGTAGTGRLTLDAGTTFDISATTAGATVGSLAGSGTIDTGTKALFAGGDNSDSSFSGTIDNGGVGWDAQYGTFTKTGTGTLDISGATITGGETYIAGGAMAQTSGTTQINYLTVGEGTGNTGNLNIGGGSLAFSTGLQVGDFGGTGTVTQTGGSVTIEAGCGDSAHCSLLNIGNQGGTGTYNLEGGTLTMQDGMLDIGRNTTTHAASTGTLNISGGELDLVTTSTETELVIGDSSAANTPGTGTLYQTGGVLSIGSGTTLYLSSYGNGEYDLDGGVLKIGGSSLAGRYGGGAATGTYAFNWNDGGIQVTGTALTTDVNATLGATAQSIIDTNGLGATWTGVLSGTGKLAKIGDGTLTLSGANTYQGGTILQNGTLAIGNDTALGTGSLEMDAGTTLDFAAGTYTVANDIAIDGDPTVNVGTGLTDTLSGIISDGTTAGDIVKTGDGELILAGVNTYTGTTTVSAGTLALSGTGSIAASSGLSLADGTTFDIAATTAGASIRSLTGTSTSNVNLGAELLTLTDAHDTFGGAIGGTGGLTISGGAEILSGANTYTGDTTVTGAALELDGSLTSNVTLGSGGILSGTGTIGTLNASPANGSLTAQAGSVIRPGGNGGSDIGTLTVNGNFTQESGSTYEVQIGAGGTHDEIAVDGVATIQSNTTLSIATSPNGLVDVPLNTPYTVLSTTGGVSGQYDNFVGTAFYGVSAGYDDVNAPHAITVTVTQDRAFAAAAATRNQTATAAGLDSLAADNALHNVIGSLTTDADARAAFDQLSGEAYASTKTALIDDSAITRDAMVDRLRQAFCDTQGGDIGIRTRQVGARRGSLCDGDGVAAWGRAYGSWGHVNGDGNAATIDHSIGGVLLGIDARVFDTWRVGILGGYGQSDFSVDSRHSSGSSDDYNVGVYAGNQWGPLAMRVGAGYAWHDVTTDRYVVLPDFADSLHGKYDADTAQVFGEVGYRIDAGSASLEPFAGVAYVNLHTDGFSETGGEAALTSRSDDTGVTFSTLGARGSLAFDLGGIGMTANGMLGWRHAFGKVTPTSTFTVDGSAPYSVAGVPIAQDTAVVEAGLGAAVTENMTVDVAYTGQFGKNAQDQGVHGTVGWKF